MTEVPELNIQEGGFNTRGGIFLKKSFYTNFFIDFFFLKNALFTETLHVHFSLANTKPGDGVQFVFNFLDFNVNRTGLRLQIHQRVLGLCKHFEN